MSKGSLYLSVAILVVALIVSYFDFNLLFHPERYHGHSKNTDFFEGWYFKSVSGDEQTSLVVIAGIFYSDVVNSPASHSFIMTIVDGKTYSKYNFGVSDFKAYHNDDSFLISIGNNFFSESGIKLDLSPREGDEKGEARSIIKGELRFKSMVPWPVTVTAPGVMGWYSYLPTLECWHGVVSMHHDIEGSVSIGSSQDPQLTTTVDFDNGKGYIEKDWGFTFPSNWIWLQTNHFKSSPNTSLFVSIASVPWKSYYFPGFLVGFYHESVLHMLTTWTGARFEIVDYKVGGLEDTVRVSAVLLVSNGEMELRIRVEDRSDGVLLHGPRNKEMRAFVRESVTCDVYLKVFDKSRNEVIFEESGHFGGCEFVGNVSWLKDNL